MANLARFDTHDSTNLYVLASLTLSISQALIPSGVYLAGGEGKGMGLNSEVGLLSPSSGFNSVMSRREIVVGSVVSCRSPLSAIVAHGWVILMPKERRHNFGSVLLPFNG